MYEKFKIDREEQHALLTAVLEEAERFIERRTEDPVSPTYSPRPLLPLPEEGMGGQEALAHFLSEYAPHVRLNSGPRFYGYIVGGVTPAALAGDWLTSLYDQNAFGMPDYFDRQIEDEAVAALKELLDLPEHLIGSFTSGATMGSVNALSVAREWAAQREGKGADDGVYGLRRPVILSGTAHPSISKGLSLLGFGRNSLMQVGTLAGREAVDIDKLASALEEHRDQPCIVVANMGTANSGDLDDLAAIAALKDRYEFFLHLDGAIGLVAAASPEYRPLFDGIERADSMTIDCHKWLNIPYDCAIALVRREHKEMQYRVYAQQTSVTDRVTDDTDFTELGNEGSRRFRALPVWLSLMAYGKKGYAEMVERNCGMARLFAEILESSGALRLVSAVRLNGFAFTLNKPDPSQQEILALRTRIEQSGEAFLNNATVAGTPVLRCSLSNWGIEERHVRSVAEAIIACARELL